MREKRLRKQEMEEQDRTSDERQTSDETLKRKAPVRCGLLSPGSSSPSSNTPDTTCSTQKLPVRKLIHLKPKTVSPLNSSITPDTTDSAVQTGTSVPVKQGDTESHSQITSSSREVRDKKTINISAPAKQSRTAAQVPSDEGPTADTTLNSNQKTLPENTTDTKGNSALMLCYSCFPFQHKESCREYFRIPGFVFVANTGFLKCHVKKEILFILFGLGI